ncbi:unnamed protein product [Tetraodon nigroviridis]|uniref:(spotted green pufferfish) hypothetical protein n=1 Tax=Tetraodon nigroviridis TaxID=99883 RepID=Q4RJQ3_TETNG|nr:unnamed protein product [Tetraodon nigroviridis]
MMYFGNVEDNVDILRELGGVTFVHNLSKSSVVHADVKEAALFTLGTVAEANEEHQSQLLQCGGLPFIITLLTEDSNEEERNKRQDFSREEVAYLLKGVKTYGFSWNSILWSYPFKPGRSNVSLAKKYRQLMVMRAALLAKADRNSVD